MPHAAKCNTYGESVKGSSEEASAAAEWATWLELRHAVLFGFIADAGAKGVRLIRDWEPEDADLATYMECMGFGARC